MAAEGGRGRATDEHARACRRGKGSERGLRDGRRAGEVDHAAICNSQAARTHARTHARTYVEDDVRSKNAILVRGHTPEPRPALEHKCDTSLGHRVLLPCLCDPPYSAGSPPSTHLCPTEHAPTLVYPFLFLFLPSLSSRFPSFPSFPPICSRHLWCLTNA